MSCRRFAGIESQLSNFCIFAAEKRPHGIGTDQNPIRASDQLKSHEPSSSSAVTGRRSITIKLINKTKMVMDVQITIYANYGSSISWLEQFAESVCWRMNVMVHQVMMMIGNYLLTPLAYFHLAIRAHKVSNLQYLSATN